MNTIDPDIIARWLRPGWSDIAVPARQCGKSLYRAHKLVEDIVEKENNMINKNCESFHKCMHVRGKGSCDGCGNMFYNVTDKDMEVFKKYLRDDIGTLVKTHGYVTFKKPSNPFAIKNVIFNPPATIVFWEDGTKTVVKAGEYDEFDPEKGMAMAISKRALGGKHDYYEPFAKWVGKYEYQCKKRTRKKAKNISKSIGKVEKIEVTDDGVRAEISTEDEWFSKWAKRQNESRKPMEEFE